MAVSSELDRLACLRVQACKFVRWRWRVVVWVASDARRLMPRVKVWLVGVPREALVLVNGVLTPNLERGMMWVRGRQARGTWSSWQAWRVAPLCLAHRLLTFERLRRAIEKRKRRWQVGPMCHWDREKNCSRGILGHTKIHISGLVSRAYKVAYLKCTKNSNGTIPIWWIVIVVLQSVKVVLVWLQLTLKTYKLIHASLVTPLIHW
jgi:hypothetical protein